MSREQFKKDWQVAIKYAAIRCNDWMLLRGKENSLVVHREDVRAIELYDDQHRPSCVAQDCVGILYCGHVPQHGIPLFGNQAIELMHFLDIHYLLDPGYPAYITAETLFKPTMAEKLRTIAKSLGARFLKG